MMDFLAQNVLEKMKEIPKLCQELIRKRGNNVLEKVLTQLGLLLKCFVISV